MINLVTGNGVLAIKSYFIVSQFCLPASYGIFYVDFPIPHTAQDQNSQRTSERPAVSSDLQTPVVNYSGLCMSAFARNCSWGEVIRLAQIETMADCDEPN
jgi:hypothetical protein